MNFLRTLFNRKQPPPISPPAQPPPRTPSQAAPSPRQTAPAKLPLIANRYEVVKTVTGGMGLVHFCRDTNDDSPIVLKTFKPEDLSDVEVRKRFLDEVDVWISLGRCPHVVHAYVLVYENEREVYLVLEWVGEGKEDASLRALLTSSVPLPTEQALLFALHIARGMRAASEIVRQQREKVLIHRDLKPENILIGDDGYARVTDFGLANAHTGGTKEYMAPELGGNGEKVDQRADIYAFGCILFEMLTGERAQRDRRLRPLPENVPEELREIVLKLLAFKPEGRYERWEEVEVATACAYQGVVGREVPLALSTAPQILFEIREQGTTLNNLGVAYRALGEGRRAIGYYEQALAIRREVGDRVGEGTTLNNLGVAYRALGEGRRAIGYYEQALAILREVSDRVGEGMTLNNLGEAYQALGEAWRAVEVYKQALTILREVRDRVGEGTTLNNLGGAYQVLGEERRTIGYYEQALTILREVGDRAGEGTTLNNLGGAYQVLGEERRAIGYCEQALAIQREVGDRAGEGVTLSNLGEAYQALGERQWAIGYYEQALTIQREVGDRAGEGMTLNNLGAAYLALGEERRAIGYCEQALAIQREVGDANGMGYTCYNLAFALSDFGFRSRALFYAEEAQKCFEQIGHHPMAMKAKELVAQLRR